MAIENKDDDQSQAAPDFLNMSDDDIANFDTSTMNQSEDPDAVVDVATDVDNDDDGQVEETEEEKAATAAAAAALDEEEKENKGTNDEVADTAAVDEVTGAEKSASAGNKDDAVAGKDGVVDPATKTDAGKDAKADVEKVDPAAADAAAPGIADGVVDYEAAYNQMMAPFKANGKTIQVKTPEDAIRLMSMGADYNKKMAGIKPSLKLLKMLETNGLLDEAQLGFLIDVHKRDPAAINKLIVDSKIDPLDLSADKASEYKPGAHSIDDQEMELNAVLDDIKDSSSYNQLLQVVSKDWDPASQREVVSHPQVLKVINGHIESGIFAVIKAEMDNERALGGLTDLSDIAAYKKIGDAIQERGGFDHLNLGRSQARKKSTVAEPVIVVPKPTQAEDDKLKDRRKAASGTKAAAPNKGVPADFNPLQMSDADFVKFHI